MNILWTTNITLPTIAEKAGVKKENKEGWLLSLAEIIKSEKDIKLGIVSFEPSLTEPFEAEFEGINYFVLPSDYFADGKKGVLEEWVLNLKRNFEPDLLHINGTEYGFGLTLLSLLGIPSAISIQGLVSVCARYLFTGFGMSYLIKHPLFFLWLYRNYKDYSNRGKRECEYFKAVNHAIGRTTWDEIHVRQINPSIVYHHCDENMRLSFYRHKWDIKSVKRHQIYISQASYQIKGFHLILDALVELKEDYPDLSVFIGGKNPLVYSSSLSDRIKSRFDYGHYLKEMISERHLDENIHFLGNLTEEEVVKNMLCSHVTLLPSTIENSPNSLCEAQCLGVPCVASYVGGTPDLTKNGELSLLYRCEEWEFLVQHVKKIFDSDEFAIKLSEKSREVALKRHDHSENAKIMLNIYKEIASK